MSTMVSARSGLFALLVLSALSLTSGAAHGQTPPDDGILFTAVLDRREITMDESVALKLSIEADGSANVDDVSFDAPDFHLVNQHQETYVRSYYENGRFGMKHTRRYTKVLRPAKTGRLTISNIHATVNGKRYSARDLHVEVKPGGQGTPPPRGYGGGAGLRGAGKKNTSLPFFVRAEVDKDRVYKGQQVIVSYYIYQARRVFNIQVEKYPVLNGFLREDLEMPVLGNRLDSEQVVLDGKLYSRALLMRYAAYPLQEGDLKIDSTSLKAYYQPNSMLDDEEEEDPFARFFRTLRPQIATSTSDPVTITVLPLPEQGKPENFSGGVGDFRVSGVLDRYEVDVNQPITLTLNVEGRGNVSSIDEPKVEWPEGIELYEVKSRSKTGPGGMGRKIFEILLIPRRPGPYQIPEIRFNFFDPNSKSYVTRVVEPFEIRVSEKDGGGLDPAGASDEDAFESEEGEGRPAPRKPSGPRGLKDSVRTGGTEWWSWLNGLALAVLAAFGLIVVRDRYGGHKKRSAPQRKNYGDSEIITKLERQLQSKGPDQLSPDEIFKAYETLETTVYDALDACFELGARALTRDELKQRVTEKYPERLSELNQLMARVTRILDFAETVRFSSGTGMPSGAAARQQLGKWLSETKSFLEALNNSL